MLGLINVRLNLITNQFVDVYASIFKSLDQTIRRWHI